MLDHLNNCKLISRQQHGFLARYSTNTQLLESCNDWAVHLSNRKQVDIAYLDFAKAFDSLGCAQHVNAKIERLRI